jgi:hypothetical protein
MKLQTVIIALGLVTKINIREDNMSDNVLKLIPKDCNFIPDLSLHDSAADLLHKLLPDGEMWQAETYDGIQFIDQGSNFNDIICPCCHKRSNLADLYDWWEDISSEFSDVSCDPKIEMPCCDNKAKVTELGFDWPAGFARFELSIWNPETTRPLSPQIMKKLEEHLGCELVEIWAHY